MKRMTLSMFALATLLSIHAHVSAAPPQAGGNALAAQTRAQCALKTTPGLTARTAASAPRRARLQTTNIAFTSGRTQPSIHCCDANGQNCSGPVDILTICPVITVECKYTENSCECNPV
jgi:hypothetical protein